MIRIALVIPTLDRSGAEKQLALLASRLPRDEFDVRVYALMRGGPFADELVAAGIPVTVIGKRLKFDPLAAWRLRRRLAHWQPDIVHSWLFAANAYCRLVTQREGHRPKLVVSERCVDVWKAGWQLRLDRRLISRTDRLVGNSQAVANFYTELGYPPDRVTVIPNAVVPPPRPELNAADLRRHLGFPDDARIVAYVGRLAPQKRVADLIWSCQLLRQADPRTRLLILGDGPQRDRLLHYVQQVEVRDYVRFLGHRDDAASLLHLIDVFWLASDFEGMSNSLMEAMSCGRPVVVSNIPPNREVVSHDREGYLVDVGDAVGFAQYTRKLFDDPDLASRLGAAGLRGWLLSSASRRWCMRMPDSTANWSTAVGRTMRSSGPQTARSSRFPTLEPGSGTCSSAWPGCCIDFRDRSILMITRITGQLARLLDGEARIIAGAFEYQVYIPEIVRRQLQSQVDENISLSTIEYFEGNPQKGGRMTPRLVGFLHDAEREFFEMICQVDGVGVKKALGAMVRPVQDIATAIEEQDVKLLSTLPGVGPAVAERIIAKLRRKMARLHC